MKESKYMNKQKGFAGVFLILIVVALIAFGVLYMFSKKVDFVNKSSVNESTKQQVSSDTSSLPQVKGKKSLNKVSDTVSGTDLTPIDKGLQENDTDASAF